MPAEWERQQSTLIGWPYNKNDWPGKFKNIPKIFAEIISKITKSQEVNLLIKNYNSKNVIKRLLRKKNAKVTLSEYSSNFFWLKSWGKNHFLIILKILIPYIVFLAFVMLILKKGKINFKLNNYIKLLLLISFIGILMWFYKAPIFRYGYSFIIIFVSLVFALIGSGSILKKNKDFIFKYLIIICLIIFSGKNLNRVLFENKNYFNYPWPKFYSYTDQNKIIKN